MRRHTHLNLQLNRLRLQSRQNRELKRWRPPVPRLCQVRALQARLQQRPCCALQRLVLQVAVEVAEVVEMVPIGAYGVEGVEESHRKV